MAGPRQQSRSQRRNITPQSNASLAVRPMRRFSALPICQASKDEILARIARAKQYKEDPAAAEAPASPPPAAAPQQQQAPAPAPPPSSSQDPSRSSWLGALGFSEGEAPGPQQELQREDQPEKREWVTGKFIPVPKAEELYSTAPKRSGSGSDAEAADWLKGVLADKGPALDPNMRMELFTEAKEEMVRQRGADIITIDPNYRPGLGRSESGSSGGEVPGASGSASQAAGGEGGEEGGVKYQPKVTTWGVFPRPKNISEAFGGGRNLAPGQALESKEAAEARSREYEKMLSKYKKAIGAEVDPEELERARALYSQGMQLLEAGQLRESIGKFDQVLELMVLRSELGGRATLQKALALDSLGLNREAEALYKTIRNHPVGAVAKRAQQLSFGFEAQTFLRTDRLNFGVKKEDYMKYFRQFADRNKVWVPSEADRLADEAMQRVSVAAAVAVIGMPLALAAVLAASAHH